MSRRHSTGSSLLLVIIGCALVSVLVWVLLTVFYDEIFAPVHSAESKAEIERSNAAKLRAKGRKPKHAVKGPKLANRAGDKLTKKDTVFKELEEPKDREEQDENAILPGLEEDVEVEDGTAKAEAFADENRLTQEDEDEDPEDETPAEKNARLLREMLGITEPKPPTHAIDVALSIPDQCVDPEINTELVPILFRHDDPALRGQSVTDLTAMLTVFRDCGEGTFEMTISADGNVDASEGLTQRRLNELKYYFRQHGVPEGSVVYPKK